MNRIENAHESTMVYGDCVQADIPRLLSQCPGLISRFPLALITRVDGARGLVTTSPAVQQALHITGSNPSWIGDSLLVSGPEVVRMHEAADGLFCWYDEVWLFRQHPVDTPPVNMTIIPGIGGHGWDYLNDAVPREIAQWVLASGCVLGLGDNVVDLNYVTIDKTIADYLHSFKDGE